MQDNTARVIMFTVIAGCITASVLSPLSTPLAAGLGQGERITRRSMLPIPHDSWPPGTWLR